MKTLFKVLVPAALVGLLIIQCKKSSSGGSGPATGGTSIKVQVLDENGSAVQGATVSVGNAKTSSDASGFATVNNARVKDGKIEVKVEKTGFFHGFRNVMVEEGNTAALSASVGLLAKNTLGTVSSGHTGTLSSGSSEQFKMVLTGEGFTDESGAAYNGSVTVFARYISAENLDRVADFMPGGDFAASFNGTDGILESYGFTATEFVGANGKRLSPKQNEARMALTLATQASTRIASDPADVYFWYFNETTRTWTTTGTPVTPATEVYMPVTSASFGNVDKIVGKSTFKARFYCRHTDTAVANKPITLKGRAGYAMIYRSQSNANGKVLIEVGVPSGGGPYDMTIDDYTERVNFPAAGGIVDRGDIDVCNLVGGEGSPRFNLTWNTPADLDLHVKTPNGTEISFMRRTADGGQLDVDCICSCANGNAENIFWSTPGGAGTYQYWVKYYGTCGSNPSNTPVAFTLIVRDNGTEVIRRTATLNNEEDESQKWTYVRQ